MPAESRHLRSNGIETAMLIAFKLKLALVCAAGLAGPLAVAPLITDTGSPDAGLRERQAMVELQPGTVSYRAAGDFTRAGKQAASPLVTVRFETPLAIMKHQASSADYQRCVDDGACPALDRGVVITADRPAVQVSWHDANAYAIWLSKKTGEHYRLPTDAEWAFAAGSKFRDDGLAVDDSDPSKRWLARYERESDRGPDDPQTHAFGRFGANENGLLDLGGNVWEWTSTCFVRTALDNAGDVLSKNPNCGVRVAEGQHRAYVTDFIRDARAGGCAAGLPPSNLGFRLVREPKAWAKVLPGTCVKNGTICNAIQSLSARLTKVLGPSTLI
jgi:formylglycine-generating enzyme required for sulfatase activity